MKSIKDRSYNLTDTEQLVLDVIRNAPGAAVVTMEYIDEALGYEDPELPDILSDLVSRRLLHPFGNAYELAD